MNLFKITQVFVTSLATILDCPGVDQGLDDFRSTDTLNFIEFEYYLAHEVFSTVNESASRYELAPIEKRIDEICWTLCKSKFDGGTKNNQLLDRDAKFKLFRIFSLLADLVTDEDGSAQVSVRAWLEKA